LLTNSRSTAAASIAIYRTSSIGDVVLASACLDLLSAFELPIHVTWLGRQPSLGLISAAYPEIDCIAVPKNQGIANLGSLAKQLRHTTMLVDLQVNLRSRLFARAVGRFGAKIFSSPKAQLRRSTLVWQARLRGRSRSLPSAVRQTETHQYLMMSQTVGDALRSHFKGEELDRLVSLTPQPRLPIPKMEAEKSWLKELTFGRWLALAPGAAHATKQAPANLVVDILKQLRERLAETSGGETGLVFLGDENDKILARQLMNDLAWPYATLNLAGMLTLTESAVALREASALLTNDSALSHIAEAVGTPSAVLFGPTAEAFGFGPRMSESRAFSSEIGCRPCSKHGRTPCRYQDQFCFTAISPATVAAHLFEILSRQRDNRVG